jgi:predicted nucleic acid-binding protein
MIVLDTNVTSELMRVAPDERVSRWVRDARPTELFTTSVIVAEVLYGIERLPDGRRRDRLQEAAEEIFVAFETKILPFDVVAARRYPEIVAGRDRSGRPITSIDAQIASICRVHGAALATRNTKDFEGTGVELLDPWAT